MDLNELDEMLGHTFDDEITTKIIRPPFGYHGSKAKSVEKIIPHLPYSDVFVDVFGGSGVITLSRKPSKMLDVYNDRWSGVVEFFRCIRDPVKLEEMLDTLKITPYSEEEFYNSKNWEQQTSDVQRAAQFYYMISTSYANLGRNWGISKSNPLYRRYFKRLNDLSNVAARFMEVQVDNADFRTIFSMYDSPTTVFYCDPPYINSEQAGSYVHRFSEQDHYDLLSCIHNAEGFVAISHRPNELYDSCGWDDIIEWEIMGSSHGAQTKTNNRIGAPISQKRIEKLYIKL